jgi:hypothetical protein
MPGTASNTRSIQESTVVSIPLLFRHGGKKISKELLDGVTTCCCNDF